MQQPARTFALLALLGLAAHATADSPMFRGPNGDGIFADTGLLKTWPEGGPALAWKAEGIGAGYAAAAIANGTVFTNGLLNENQGFLFAFSLDGKEKWRVNYGPETLEKQATGSRGTPCVDGDRVYVASGLGLLSCHAVADGKMLWQVDVAAKYHAQETMWAISESPIIDGDLVFSTPGGPNDTIVAFNKMTGEQVWSANINGERSAYCTPDVFQFGKNRVLVTMTAKSVVGVDVKDGKVLWVHPHPTNYDIHATTPVAAGNVIYYSAGYGSGGGALDVSEDGTKVTQKWLDSNLDCQHHGLCLVDGYVYGTGHQNNKLFCLELATGKEMWSTSEVTQGNIIFDEGMLYVYQGPKKGIVALVKADPKAFSLAGTLQVPPAKDKHWAHPAIADGKLFIRHAGTLYAYDIKAK